MKRIIDINLDGINKNGDLKLEEATQISNKDIAIIGVSSKMSLAEDTEAFWNNLCNSTDCVREIDDDRKADIIKYMSMIGRDEYAFQDSAYIEDIDKFDNLFFDMAPREAQLTDPNQRLFLETAWSALEDAGYIGESIRGSRTGVYVGASGEEEYKKFIQSMEPEAMSMAVPGNVSAVIASRLSHLLDLKGPSMLINTSCSSSLVAVHVACQAIRNRECEMAVAGGIRMYLLPFRETKIGVESSSGRTKSFDDSSDGLGAGEGVVAIILKPLSRALEDHDNIYAVIRGSAVNQDGNSIGITAPNVSAQEDVIVRALTEAGLGPESIDYIEAHGSGTKLGDPIEIEGITNAYRRYTYKNQFCGIGSVKTNIGHLDCAAGIAGLLKAILIIKNRKIPANAHFMRPNREISFTESPIYINDENISLETLKKPITCAVSSFGMSGTNCHMIIQEPPEIERQPDNITKQFQAHVLIISAKSESSLKISVQKYLQYAQNLSDTVLPDICYMSCTRREFYRFRLVLSIKDCKELRETLSILNLSFADGIRQDNVFYSGEEATAVTKQDNINKASTFEYTAEDISVLCKRFINGEWVNWNLLYKPENHKKVSIPTYSFVKTRNWVGQADFASRINKVYYMMDWKHDSTAHMKTGFTNKTVLVLGCNAKTVMLSTLLRDSANTVLEVIYGNDFKKINKHQYMICKTNDSYDWLFRKFTEEKIVVTDIIHARTWDDHQDIGLSFSDARIEKGVCDLFRLVKGLLKSSLRKSINLFVVSEYVDQVAEKDDIKPENAALFGFGKIISWNSPNIKVRCIDTDHETHPRQVLQEMGQYAADYKIAYRNGQRYTEFLKEIESAELTDYQVKLQKNGVYIITGGLGNIGRVIALNLAKQENIRLVLIQRTSLPDEELWNDIIFAGKDRDTIDKLRDIRKIRDKGASVTCYSVDVTDEAAMSQVLEDIRDRFGQINGVIHGAGIGVGAEEINIEDETEEIFKLVMSPKIKGTWILNSLTEIDKLDFFVSFSSAVSLIGGVSGGEYVAANSFLDAFAYYRNKKLGNTLTIGWPVWKQNSDKQTVFHADEKQIFKKIAPHEAMSSFNTILNKKVSHVFIGEFNYQSEVFSLSELLPFNLSDQLDLKVNESSQQKPPRTYGNKHKIDKIELLDNSSDDYTSIEEKIAFMWKEVLGYQLYNIDDNFFEIGGDSIKILKVHAMIDKAYPDKVLMPDLFAYPTIRKLAKYIHVQIQDRIPESTENSTDDMMKLLNKLETGEISVFNALEEFKSIGD